MKPILFPTTEMDFASNGIGILTDAVSCFVDAEVNSIYELEMQYPVDGIHFEAISKNMIILAKPDPVAEPQPFRIYRISKPIGGNVKVYARHIAYDMAGIPISPFNAESAQEAMSGLKENAAVSCPFSFETDKNVTGTIEIATPNDGWSIMGKSSGCILSVYGGEYEFDRFSIRLLERLGADSGVSIRYGNNLKSFEQDENCGEVYTGIYPYWKGKDGTIVSLSEKVVPAEGTYDHIKIKPVDLSKYFDAEPTQEQLRDKAKIYIRDNEIGIPKVSWTISYVKLSQTEEYKNTTLIDDVRLGDSITVIFPKMNVHVTSRVVKTRYNVLYDRHENISVGSVKQTISDTIAKQSQEVASIGGGLSAAEADIKDMQETVDGIRIDTNECIADIGDVRSGLYAIATADDINGLKEANTTLFAQIWDNFEEVYSGLELRVKSEDFGKYVEAQAELTTRIGTAETTLLQKVSAKEFYEELGKYQTIVASNELAAKIDDDIAGLSERVTQTNTELETVRTSENNLCAALGVEYNEDGSIKTIEAIASLDERTSVTENELGTITTASNRLYAALNVEKNPDGTIKSIGALAELNQQVETVKTETHTNTTSITRIQNVVGDASSGLVLRVTQAENGINTNTSAITQLTTKIGSVEAGLSQKIGNDELEEALKNYTIEVDLSDYLTVKAAAELYVTDQDVTAAIGAYIVTDSNGNKKTLAAILADQIKLQGDTKILGNLTIDGGNLKSTKGIVSENGITGASIYANGTGSQGIISGRRVSCTEIAVGGKNYTETEITSTTGTVRVLGIA